MRNPCFQGGTIERQRRVVLNLHHARHAAMQCSRGAVIPTFFVLEARVTEVHMHINQTGDDAQALRIQHRQSCAVQSGSDLIDNPTHDADVHRCVTGMGRPDTSAAYQQVRAARCVCVCHDVLRRTTTKVVSSHSRPPVYSSKANRSASTTAPGVAQVGATRCTNCAKPSSPS